MQPTTRFRAPIDVDVVVGAVGSMIETRRGTTLSIGPHTRLDELGLSSLDFAEAFVTIEEAVGYHLDPESAGDMAHVGDLVHLRPL